MSPNTLPGRPRNLLGERIGVDDLAARGDDRVRNADQAGRRYHRMYKGPERVHPSPLSYPQCSSIVLVDATIVPRWCAVVDEGAGPARATPWRRRLSFICQNCGAVSALEGRCEACGEWNTIIEEAPAHRRAGPGDGAQGPRFRPRAAAGER